MWIKKIKEKSGQLLIDFLGDNLYWFQISFGFILLCKDKFHIVFKT